MADSLDGPFTQRPIHSTGPYHSLDNLSSERSEWAASSEWFRIYIYLTMQKPARAGGFPRSFFHCKMISSLSRSPPDAIICLFTHSFSFRRIRTWLAYCLGVESPQSPWYEIRSPSRQGVERSNKYFYGEVDVEDEDDLASKAPNSIRDPVPAFWGQAKLFRPRDKVVPVLNWHISMHVLEFGQQYAFPMSFIAVLLIQDSNSTPPNLKPNLLKPDPTSRAANPSERILNVA